MLIFAQIDTQINLLYIFLPTKNLKIYEMGEREKVVVTTRVLHIATISQLFLHSTSGDLH
jgi:hypothetical protein